MRSATIILAVGAVLVALPAMAAALSPDEIKTTFATGKPFSAVSASGKTFKMTFKDDGSALMLAKGAKKGQAGKWRVSDKGYCTTWGKSSEHCYTVEKGAKQYDVLDGSGKLVAHWTL